MASRSGSRSLRSASPRSSRSPSKAAVDFEEDLPGYYLVVHNNAAVRETSSLDSPVVAQLAAGEVVHVLEVLPMPQVDRVRAKIDHPSGWISLLETKEGYRWAIKQAGAPKDPWALKKAQLVADVKRRDAELQQLLAVAERLRAEHQRSLQSTEEIAADVEERVLKGYRVCDWSSSGQPATPFAYSEKAAQMQKLAVQVGRHSGAEHRVTSLELELDPGCHGRPSLLCCRLRLKTDGKDRSPSEVTDPTDPKYQVPAGLPPGSKVVGFRKLPSPHTEEAQQEKPQASGRVVHSNAILQPSRVYSTQPADVYPAEGVYPIVRAPMGVATNLLERPLAEASAAHWTAPEDFGEAQSCLRSEAATCFCHQIDVPIAGQ
ncbi:unnamed protein product [Symbiodinium necroappetens]|uniref:Uncharacterized protein n=1 Tax=Symbiodinium necroappetens TaxID=1628268 RepID=A0A812VL45_9DINO|nr:unnamed protein product [Symbiodinium necroappetens]